MARWNWIGIDEAGYGPNLGPLVMTAVTAESLDGREPDLWNDLPDSACRAGGPADRLWIDDSKAILATRHGRAHLERACLAAITAASQESPSDLAALFHQVGAGDLDQIELGPWLETTDSTRISIVQSVNLCNSHWKMTRVRSVVVGPAQFNQRLRAVDSKAVVHFEAFAELLRDAWDRADDGAPTQIRGDKHGGRNFYAGPLAHALPDGWVTPETEGALLSRYTVRGPGRSLRIEFQPRADAADGLVALASIVSKHLRERWMEAFNQFWAARIPGLRPTAGYPVDARRFRDAIEPTADALGLPASLWWRDR